MSFVESLKLTFARISTELEPSLKEKFTGQVEVEKVGDLVTTIRLGDETYQLKYEPESSPILFVLYKLDDRQNKFVLDTFLYTNTPAIVDYLMK